MEKAKFKLAQDIQDEINNTKVILDHAKNCPTKIRVWDSNRGRGIEYETTWNKLIPYFNKEKVEKFLQEAIIKAAELKIKDLEKEFENL